MRNRGIELINILGLASGLTAVFFIVIWINYSLSYDKWHENSDRIFRVESLLDFTGDPFVWNVAPGPVAESLKEDFPEVEEAVNLYAESDRSLKSGQQHFTANNIYYTNSKLFSVFSYKLASGDSSTVFNEPNSIVLSESAAKQIFGDENPVGKTLLFQNEYLLEVKGILKSQPTNSHIVIDYLIPQSLLVLMGNGLQEWAQFDHYTYILLKEGVDPDSFNRKIAGYLHEKSGLEDGRLFLNPLERLYLYRDPGLPSIKYPGSDKGPVSGVRLFGIVGIVLLCIAWINFINMSIAVSSTRSREIGIRKVNGAGRKDLIVQFFGESILQTGCSMVFALILVVLLRSLFIKIIGKDLPWDTFLEWGNILIVIITGMATAIVTGLYPAFVLSEIKPAGVMKVSPSSLIQGSGIRKILVLIQFAVSTIFIFCVLIMWGQMRFFQNVDTGFDGDRIMVIFPDSGYEVAKVIKEEIRNISGIREVALGGSVPVNMGNWNTIYEWEGNTSGKSLRFYMMQMDDNYFDLLGFELIGGRQLYHGSPRNEVIINEAAVIRMELAYPLGKRIKSTYDNKDYTIVGIVKDFHFMSMREDIDPVFMYKNQIWLHPKIFIRLETAPDNIVIEKITRIVREHDPGFSGKYIFLDEEIEKYYTEERRYTNMLNISALLSIIISAVGLFSLTVYSLRKRQKEIGIRKAMGSSKWSLLRTLSSEQFRLLFAGFVLALPFAHIIMNKWLSTYAYHINIKFFNSVYTIIILAGVLILAIATQVSKASQLNPAELLRDRKDE